MFNVYSRCSPRQQLVRLGVSAVSRALVLANLFALLFSSWQMCCSIVRSTYCRLLDYCPANRFESFTRFCCVDPLRVTRLTCPSSSSRDLATSTKKTTWGSWRLLNDFSKLEWYMRESSVIASSYLDNRLYMQSSFHGLPRVCLPLYHQPVLLVRGNIATIVIAHRYIQQYFRSSQFVDLPIVTTSHKESLFPKRINWKRDTTRPTPCWLGNNPSDATFYFYYRHLPSLVDHHHHVAHLT